MRMKTGGRLDFWTLENSIAGRGRRYHRIVIDEAAFTKDGDNKVDGSMMELWEKSIKPTLYDYGGEALVSSNSAGKNSDNFLLQYLHRSTVWLQGVLCHHDGQPGASEAPSE
jgi:hypothetical protein